MQNICPISFNRINENVARFNGVFTTTISVVYLITGLKLLPLLLFIDFFTRGFNEPKYSILTLISKGINKSLHIKPKMQNAGPKIFAAQIGAFLTGLAVLSHYFGIPVIGLVSIAMLGFFSFLEGAFAYCVACKIYPFIRKYSPESFDAGL